MEPSEDVTGTLYKQFFQPGEGDIHTVKDLLFLKYLPCAKNSAMPPAFISFHPYLPRDWIQSAPFKGVKAEALVGEVVWPSALIVSGRTRSETQTYPKPIPSLCLFHCIPPPEGGITRRVTLELCLEGGAGC